MPILVSDDFDRASNQSMGANWTEKESGTTALQIVNDNYARCRSVGETGDRGLAYYNQEIGNDQWAEAVFIVSSTMCSSGPAVRIDPNSTPSSSSCYSIFVDDGGTPDLRLYKFNAADHTQTGATSLATPAVLTVLSQQLVRITVEGTTVKAFVEGDQKLSATDSALASGRAGLSDPGIPSFTTTGDWDYWRAGTMPAPADLRYTSEISNSGWTNVANIFISNNTRATSGDPGDVFSVELENIPGDFSTQNSVIFRIEARTVGTVSRPKQVQCELLDSGDNVLQTYTTPDLTATDRLYVSAPFTRSDSSSTIDGYRLRCTVTESGGMPDTATVEIDTAKIRVDYNAAPAGRTATALASYGGLAGPGGLAGNRGGLAG